MGFCLVASEGFPDFGERVWLVLLLHSCQLEKMRRLSSFCRDAGCLVWVFLCLGVFLKQ